MIIWPCECCDARASFLSCKLILAPNDHTVTPLHPDAAVEWSIPNTSYNIVQQPKEYLPPSKG